MVGQQHVTTTLQNAIQSQHLAQAFLFCGPRGSARPPAPASWPRPSTAPTSRPRPRPAGMCTSCVAFQENASFNVHELDAASNNSVEDIRSLRGAGALRAAAGGKYKIYIIDEVHMLSNAAFNAFLKTLEEPPSYAIFILATTERHKIIPTILSRCQIFDFNRIRVDDIREHLRYVATSEGVTADDDALHLLAQKADGGLRDALSMFDQHGDVCGQQPDATRRWCRTCTSWTTTTISGWWRRCCSENLSAALLLLDEVMQQGLRPAQLRGGHRRAFARPAGVQRPRDGAAAGGVGGHSGSSTCRQAQAAPLPFLLSALNLVSQCDREFKQAKNQRLHVELTLMKVAYLNGAVQFVRDLTPAGNQRTSANGEAKN
ncbi:MAG: DNA polymerase III subunit gamma/tau [Hymenobacter sp.]